MDKKNFIIVPKLLGLIVDPRSSEVAGMIDASGLLADESREALTETLGEVVATLQIESERHKLEEMFMLPARDVEKERELGGEA